MKSNFRIHLNSKHEIIGYLLSQTIKKNNFPPQLTHMGYDYINSCYLSVEQNQ